MKVDLEKVRDLFKYHPPVNPDRVEKHKFWNDLCLTFAQDACKIYESKEEYLVLLHKIQEIRMLGNAEITNNDIGLDYNKVFVDED